MSCNSRLSSSLTTGSSSTMPRLQRDWNLSNLVQHKRHRLTYRREVPTGPAQDRHDPAGHIFAPVIAGSFNDGAHTAVPHR